MTVGWFYYTIIAIVVSIIVLAFRVKHLQDEIDKMKETLEQYNRRQLDDWQDHEQRPFIYGDDFDLIKWYNEAAFKRMGK